MTEVEELKAKLDEQKRRIELMKKTMQAIGDNSKSERAREYIRLWRNEMAIKRKAQKRNIKSLKRICGTEITRQLLNGIPSVKII